MFFIFLTLKITAALVNPHCADKAKMKFLRSIPATCGSAAISSIRVRLRNCLRVKFKSGASQHFVRNLFKT